MKNFKDFINESRSISKEIKDLANDYSDNIGVSIKQINRGYCDEFASELLGIMGGKSKDVFLLATNSEYDEENAIEWVDEKNPLYYKKFSNVEPKFIKKISKPDHVWLYYKGKHYDAETPNGVKDFIDLPFFKRYLK